MQKLLVQFTVTLAAIVVALVAYDYSRRPDMTAAKAQTAELKHQAAVLVETTQSQTQELSRQAKALSEQANALKDEVAAEHHQAAIQRQRATLGLYLAQGVQAVGAAKVAVAEYYYNNGKLPASNRDAGMAEPDEYKSASVRRMVVSKGGVVTLIFDEKSGIDNGTLKLIPKVKDGPGSIEWHCVSPSFATIADVLPQCQYVAADEPPAKR